MHKSMKCMDLKKVIQKSRLTNVVYFFYTDIFGYIFLFLLFQYCIVFFQRCISLSQIMNFALRFLFRYTNFLQIFAFAIFSINYTLDLFAQPNISLIIYNNQFKVFWKFAKNVNYDTANTVKTNLNYQIVFVPSGINVNSYHLALYTF